jgi:hypothetical protein
MKEEKIMEKIALEFSKSLAPNLAILIVLNLALMYTAFLPYGNISWLTVLMVALAVGVIDALIAVKFPIRHPVLAFVAEFLITFIALVSFNWLIGVGVFMEIGKLTVEFTVLVAVVFGIVKTLLDTFIKL